MKFGFIDRSFPQPAAGTKTFEQWRRVDLMATSWIWNSISKDIVETFMYASSSRELWLELQRRYRRSNGLMLYQIQRELSTISHGDLSVTAYLTKDQNTSKVMAKDFVHKRLYLLRQDATQLMPNHVLMDFSSQTQIPGALNFIHILSYGSYKVWSRHQNLEI
ncbi:UNVERIFIED_CONTAM: hypothetical protein Slati_1911100 [Sesamum latifolium]|uniref:Retrotransposon Copia-like N-terminal domain-containing protein n=1 Tax=Sesamum latifolium TaxID=2727402 RepID=A0AAW2X181_9LAMI